MADTSPAQVSSARAYQDNGDYLMLEIAGEAPTPCHHINLERPTAAGTPLVFEANWTAEHVGVCPEVVTPYERSEVFHVGGKQQSVVVKHAGGQQTVAVKPFPARFKPPGTASKPATPRPKKPRPSKPRRPKRAKAASR